MQQDMESKISLMTLTLSNTIIKNRNRHLKPLALTAAQANALQHIALNPGISATELKDYFEISHQAARALVERLEEKGWVYLEKSEDDARRRDIFVTEEGKKMVNRTMLNRERTGEKLLKGMSAEEKSVFLRLLTRAYENVKND